MMDQEKSDFLKARLIAEKNKQSQEPKTEEKSQVAKTIDASVSLLTFVLGFISTYFTQSILLTKFTTVIPFGFWESLAIYLCFTSTLKILVNSIRMIGHSFRK